MKKFTRSVVGVLAAAATALLTPAPASAITGGTADGDAHPSVGMIVFYENGGRYRCSATLVSPTVLLTAAHCTAGTAGKTAVTFDSVIAEAPPSGLPVADDPAAGYTSTEITHGGYLAGTSHAHPDYSDFTDMQNWNDVGVVQLDEPVQGITPSPIAPPDYLEQFQQPTLNKTLFTIVGYGTEVRKPDAGPQKPTPMSYPLLRRVAEAPGQKLTPQILQVNGNPNDTKGTGGSCFGDSGGPTFHSGYVVTVTSYGYTDNCRYLDGLQRVDIASVQDWLATYEVRPAS
ncbi:trypsin-like serine protease [Cumulibacter manganitolerans]|uniref:trypsin-like serine protease n=1 Tax=Cumulibacter manganitolerans TaxID=1884992 RepID=UPI0012957919|nr:trypsin-like serine protease [Cumulibacter manganitolerans]